MIATILVVAGAVYLICMGLFVKKSEDNSKLHRRYLDQISKTNSEEIDQGIFGRYSARYDWLRECHNAAFNEGWKLWKPARDYYVGGEAVLRPAKSDDDLFTYHLDPNIPNTKEEYVA